MKKILRTQHIDIDIPTPNSDAWMNVIVQYVEMDDQFKPLNVVDRWGQLSVRVAAIATNICQLVDPVPVPDGIISAAGIANGLSSIVIDLIIQKYGGVFDPATGYIIME